MTSGFGRQTVPGSFAGDEMAPMFIKGGRGWRPRDADGWRPGFGLAVAAHGLLVLGLVFSVNWKLSQEEPAVEAELWSEIPRGAPPVVTPPPPPKVEPQPEPVKPPPKVAERAEPEPVKRPDIVTERAPKKEEKPRREPKETFDTTPPKPVKKPEPAKDDKAEKLARERAEQAEKAEKAEKAAKAKAEKDRLAREAQAAAEREAQRKANLARMMNELGGTGGAGVPSATSAGPSAAYAGRIKARIKPNIVFTEQVAGNPLARVEVRCAPDGRIMARKLTSSSGVAAWDEAVLRAVDRTEVLPADERGKVPSVLLLEFRPNDF